MLPRSPLENWKQIFCKINKVSQHLFARATSLADTFDFDPTRAQIDGNVQAVFDNVQVFIPRTKTASRCFAPTSTLFFMQSQHSLPADPARAALCIHRTAANKLIS